MYGNGIRFWNSALLPVLVVFGELATGGTILLATAFDTLQIFARFAQVFYAASLFILLWISTYSSPEAKESALLLLKGSLAGLFWILIILIGIVIPLVLEFVTQADSSILLIISSVLMILGNLTLRYSLIRAGRYTP